MSGTTSSSSPRGVSPPRPSSSTVPYGSPMRLAVGYDRLAILTGALLPRQLDTQCAKICFPSANCSRTKSPSRTLEEGCCDRRGSSRSSGPKSSVALRRAASSPLSPPPGLVALAPSSAAAGEPSCGEELAIGAAARSSPSDDPPLVPAAAAAVGAVSVVSDMSVGRLVSSIMLLLGVELWKLLVLVLQDGRTNERPAGRKPEGIRIDLSAVRVISRKPPDGLLPCDNMQIHCPLSRAEASTST